MKSRGKVLGRIFLTLMLLAAVLAGCGNDTVQLSKGDFTFQLPEGYRVEDVQDRSCTLVRDEDGTQVGGIVLTDLQVRYLKKDKKSMLPRYLQDFHHTLDLEYISSNWGDRHPIVEFNMKVGSDTPERKTLGSYSHIFFEKDGAVYHLWLDQSQVDADIISAFRSITKVD